MQLREGVGFPSTCRELVPYRRRTTWRDPNGFYRILGLAPNATDDEIRHAGRELLRRHHPDGPEPDEEIFFAVEEAYRCLRRERHVYDAVPPHHVMVTENNKTDPRLTHVAPGPQYTGWSYFSEVPRVTDDSVALWAYEQYLTQALATPTSMPCIAVVLLQGEGDPWLEDGLIYVPMSEIRGKLAATSGIRPGAQGQG